MESKTKKCRHCLSTIDSKASICQICQQRQRFSLSPQFLISTVAILLSIISLYISYVQHNYQKISYRYQQDFNKYNLMLDTLEKIQSLERKMDGIVNKVSRGQNLTINENFTLNYYETMLKSISKNASTADFFALAESNYDKTIKIRLRPSVKSPQIQGKWVAPKEKVKVLGQYSYNDRYDWYFILKEDGTYGWAYKYFTIIGNDS